MESWTFSTVISAQEVSGLLEQQQVLLQLDGVDTYADVLLNGEKVAATTNFHRWGLPNHRLCRWQQQGCWRHRGVTEGVEVGVGVGRNDDNEAATTSAGGLLHKCSSRGGSSMCAAKRRCVGGERWGCHSSGVSKSSREDTSKTTEGAFRLVEGRGN